jgi:putative serine protease PepD
MTTAEAGGRRLGTGGRIAIAVAVVVLAVIGSAVGLSIGREAERFAGTPAASGPITPLPQQSPGTQPPAPGSIAALAATALPGVVSLRVEAGLDSSSGSGFFVRSDGYVVTNNHVIEAAARSADTARIEVILDDGRRATAQIVGRNTSYDLAVLVLDPREDTELDAETDAGSGWEVPVLDWADSRGVRVGDGVLAIGAPLGLSGTVTQGIVSALDRPVTVGDTGESTSYINAIQTDAPINPGNSGGPLLDGDGLVVGVNSAVATLAFGASSGSIGLGFAIPASDARRIADEIIDTGGSTTPVIGVTLDPFYAGIGARVESVTPGSPADAAGLAPGDVIVEIDGRPIPDARTLIVAIRANAPGDTISVTAERGARVFTTEVTLEARTDVP